MSTCATMILIAIILTAAALIAGFAWLNRNKGSALDAVEDWDRERAKKG